MRNSEQEKFSINNPLDGLASRLALVVNRSGLNQSEFARKLGVSAGFMSDVLRGQKKPGAEFLYGLSTVFSVSADWLLTGKGTINGATGIDMAFMKMIELHIALAKSAVFDNNGMAQLLLHMAKEGKLSEMDDSSELTEFFRKIRPVDPEHELAFDIYNSQLWTADPDAQMKNSLSTALAWFQARKPIDPRAVLQPSSSGSGVTQIITNSGNKTAGRDFYEK
ncbi:hypothetical protein NB716_001580 [Pantoea ananatis]|uniref:helix-turn-helix domain-containing protein n=1 Tax=Pantoea ananas TaxID=553 RepID=UPI0021F793A2|nr:helix-turn-helix domain-containing protein [Pantoea ananatis]MCW0352786.1 hypothetical protein [Pantoea ananatis]